MLRFVLELVRILAIFLILGALLSSLAVAIYAALGINLDNTNGGFLVGGAILIFLFVLYRNKLQFSGFYKGKGMVKLHRKISISLLTCSALMLLTAPFLA